MTRKAATIIANTAVPAWTQVGEAVEPIFRELDKAKENVAALKASVNRKAHRSKVEQLLAEQNRLLKTKGQQQ